MAGAYGMASRAHIAAYPIIFVKSFALCLLLPLPLFLLSLLLSSPMRIVFWVFRRVEQLALRPFLYVLLLLMSTREFQDFRCVARIRNL